MVVRLCVVALALLLATACSMVQPAPAMLGDGQNPVKLALLSTVEPQRALVAGDPLARQLEQVTGVRIKLTTPTSDTAAIEGMGTHNVDIGWLAPLAYLQARERVGAEPLLASVRGGAATTRGQIVVHADSGIINLEDLRRKRLALVEPPSVTGNLLPRAFLLSAGLDPASAFGLVTLLGNDSEVVLAVYRRQVDAGAILAERSPRAPGDARLAVQRQAPDVLDKVRILARTEPAPNDTLVARKGLPAELVRQIRDGLLQVASSPAGAQALRELDNIEGLSPVTDADFQPLRDAAALGHGS